MDSRMYNREKCGMIPVKDILFLIKMSGITGGTEWTKDEGEVQASQAGVPSHK